MRCDFCGGEAAQGALSCEFCGNALRPGPSTAGAWPTGASVGPDAAHGNTSGTQGWVPPEVAHGFNWGGFLGTGAIWAFSMGLMAWGFAALLLGPLVHVALGTKGNEWAWQGRRFASVEEFQQVQRIWALWGLALTVAPVALGAILVAAALVLRYV